MVLSNYNSFLHILILYCSLIYNNLNQQLTYEWVMVFQTHNISEDSKTNNNPINSLSIKVNNGHSTLIVIYPINLDIKVSFADTPTSINGGRVSREEWRENQLTKGKLRKSIKIIFTRYIWLHKYNLHSL